MCDDPNGKSGDDAWYPRRERLDPLIVGAGMVTILLLPGLLLAVYLGWISIGAFARLAAPLLLVVSISWMVLLVGRGIDRSRRIRELSKHDYRICQTCGYQLEGLPDEGTCPECGSSYDRQKTIRIWRNRMLFPWRLVRKWEWRVRRSPLERLGFLAVSCAAMLLVLCVAGWFVMSLATNLRLILLALLTGACGAFLLAVARRRIRTIVTERHNRVCPWCLGDLPETSDEGECPRCGLPFQMERVEAVWGRGYLRIPWRIERVRPRGPRLPRFVRAWLIVMMVFALLSAACWHWWLVRASKQPDLLDTALCVGMVISGVVCVVAGIRLLFAVGRGLRRSQ
jgi:hypothetical protein